ncbi:disease resistance protein RGA5-like [Triticum aestivum]|uniref:Disease resistance protein RPM1 n=1 Tax=Aegilops tauschii TaxID=37682 RepID=M8B188_AEGTA|nr:disease resistance protein RGA5-like [Triticum aestivum]
MEVMAGAVLSALLHKLDAVLTDEYRLQRSLRGEIMFLRAELESMQAALERVSSPSAQPVDRQVRIWAGQVRELSYDVEDSIDRFMVRVDLHHPGFSGFIGRCLSLLTTARVRHRIATDIRGIRGLVKEVADRRGRYRVDDGAFAVRRPAGATVDPRLHGMYEDSARLVAVGGPRAELCRLLVEQEGAGTMDGQLKVVSIVGVGGLGKTTLANVVYQQIRGRFDCDAFVTVSLKPDLRRVLGSLLRQVSKQSYSEVEAWDVVELIDKIRQVLQDKRYLIIVDDIWDESAWNCIKTVLVENNCSSRVITTTRIAGVAASCSSSIDGNIYKLNPLGHDDSKKLFHERIFGSEDGCHVKLREISQKIIRKCDGVPLAIITIASLLSHKSKNIHEWDTVNKSIGSGLEKFPNMENMRQILSISYYDLPSHLKPCFLYLSVYPEDYAILSDHLLRKLVCLYIETSVRLPDGIGAMKSLQVLSTVGVGASPNFSKELGYLTDLRILKISLSGTWDKNYEKHLLCSLCKLTKIKEISIQSSGVPTKFIVDLGWTPHNLRYFFGNIPRLPEWMNSSLSELSTLIITLDKIQQEDLGTLGNIPFLHYLCVTVHKIKKAEERLIIGTDHANFKCLSEFHIHNDSLGIMFVEGAMPRLQTLEVTFQVREAKDEYNNFEVGLENLHSVKLVTIRMHCCGSSLIEVEEAGAAMRKTSYVNPKHPRVDVIRYYEDEMIEDEEKSQLDEEAFKEQEIILEKIGPWGGNTGRKRDIKVAPRYLRSVRICCGDVIDAFAFSYLDKNENLHETPLWGGVGGTIHTILLEPSELVLEISGTFGPYGQFPSIIKSLMLVTNLRTYGPFGQLHGTPFHSRVKKNGTIVGFFGCSGEFLDAIGVYIHP